MPQAVTNLGLSTVFAVLGFILLFAGYRMLDVLTPLDMSKRIFEDGNTAVAILAAGFVIAMAIIIAAAIS